MPFESLVSINCSTMAGWRMHADQSPLFAEYLLLAQEAGWGDLMDEKEKKIGLGDVLIVADMQTLSRW